MSDSLPRMPCDLVMKGGLTSGVLYPPAIREIARKYWFVGIGGTSAGAIAASLAAAAEYRRRQTGSDEGFDDLEAISEELAGSGKLLSLFRPDRETRKLFKLALRFIEGKAGIGTKLRVGRMILFSREKVFRKIVGNGFGVCTGMANGNRSGSDLPLTEWLADRIDQLAGKEDGTPLTFKDLHEARSPEILERLRGPSESVRSIDFRAITTSVTFGRPLEIPFRERIFAFRPDEWRRLFPARIVDHLVAKAETIESKTRARDGCLPLPDSELPVIVAARMSLSFPMLFTMVPLYAVNFHKEGQPLERVWFSDGGITSNFPIHRFDGLYPSWPTLGINLQYTDDSEVPQRSRLAREGSWVHLPSDRSRGTLDLWRLFEDRDSETAKILGFVGSIFGSAQVWHDNAFLKLPGFRDRLAEIWLTPEEGGLNLDMPPETIDALTERGRQAGREIAARFADTPPGEAMSWNAHRWARLRSGLAGLYDSLLELAADAAKDVPGTDPLATLLASREAPPAYEFSSDRERRAAQRAIEELLRYVDGLEGENPLASSAPRPHVDIGTRALV